MEEANKGTIEVSKEKRASRKNCALPKWNVST
jgi:hypothetical protein